VHRLDEAGVVERDDERALQSTVTQDHTARIRSNTGKTSSTVLRSHS
jgi:hypothetical protein